MTDRSGTDLRFGSNSGAGTNSNSGISRRHFLKAAGAVAALSQAKWAHAARAGANDRITIGVIGWGMIGPANAKAFLSESDCQVVAACDLDPKRLQTAVDTINGKYGNTDCKAYRDYREIIARDDIDAVMIAIPDQWHAIVATEAANRKKDIYGEKPLARTIAEQQAIVRAVEKNNIIWQTGSWQRSLPEFHKAAEIVRNGLIGTVTHVEIGLPGAPHDFPNTVPSLMAKLSSLPDKITSPSQIVPGTKAWDIAVSNPPADFDYDVWLGPSKMEPYIEQRVFQNWRWNYNTGGGQLMDWIGHHGDIAHWGLGFDLSGPSEVEGHGEFPAENAVWNVATKYTVTCTYRKEVTGYANDVTITIAGGSPAISPGAKWIGTDGWVWVDRSGFDASNPEWAKMETLPDDLRKVKLYESKEHRQNFLDSVRSRKPTITPVQVAHHSTIPGHLGLISMLTGRKIHWDVKTETILNDEGASEMLTRPYRAPWRLA
ncbi:MAG TPA: Gfo/Idh/MocA family oxidoreductase [Terracidiphilus sp.]|nr:Gfo/Idh/MocA family oxidoreductase [Terracidiphilus sp.]